MASVTVKNIPEDLYEKIRLSAALHRRSINSELIHCIESILTPEKIDAPERIKRARWLRSSINKAAIDPREIASAISGNRP